MWKRVPALSTGPRALLAGLLLLYIGSMTIWIFFPGLYASPGEWAPYRVVRTALDPDKAANLLREAGVQSVVSPDSTGVFVTRFSRIDTLVLADALEQLDVLDPRRDPFISQLGRYFTSDGSSEHLVYVRSRLAPRRLAVLVRDVLDGQGRLVSSNSTRLVPAIVLFLCGAVAVMAFTRRERLGVALVVPPLLPLVFASGLPGSVVALLLLLGFQSALSGVRGIVKAAAGVKRELLRALAYPAAVAFLSAAALWTIVDASSLLVFLPALAGASAATALSLIVGLGGSVDRDHDLFAPISLFTGQKGRLSILHTLRSRPWIAGIAAGALLAFPPLLDLAAAQFTPVIPRRVDAGAPGPVTFESAKELWMLELPNELPDVSDFLAHRAYQEGLAYGRPYGLPSEGETVTLSRFNETETGSYERFSEEVIEFDTAWLAKTIDAAPAGIAQMLVTVAGDQGVVPRREHGLYSGYPQALKHTAYVLLALLPVALARRRGPVLHRRRSKVVEIARRRKQVA